MWFNSAVINLQVLLQQWEGFPSGKEAEMLIEFKTTLLRLNNVGTIARDRSPEVDKTIGFIFTEC